MSIYKNLKEFLEYHKNTEQTYVFEYEKTIFKFDKPDYAFLTGWYTGLISAIIELVGIDNILELIRIKELREQIFHDIGIDEIK